MARRSAVGNHTRSITRRWGPTVNIGPPLSQTVITTSYNYIWQTSNYQHNEANYYSARDGRWSCEHDEGLLLCRVDQSRPSALRQKNTSVRHTAYRRSHKTNNRGNRWRDVNWLLSGEVLCTGQVASRRLHSLLLQSGDSWSCRAELIKLLAHCQTLYSGIRGANCAK